MNIVFWKLMKVLKRNGNDPIDLTSLYSINELSHLLNKAQHNQYYFKLISPIYWRMTSLGNGRINSWDVSSKKASCFSFIQILKFRMLELYCSRVLGTNRSSLISAAIVVPSRRSALSEVDDDIIFLTIWMYYVFNDCTKTSTRRVTGRIKLQRGLVYVTGVGNPRVLEMAIYSP